MAKFEKNRFIFDEVRNFTMKCMLVGKRLKIHNALDITPIFLKLWIFTNLNVVFPVVVLVFDEFSEGVLHGHCSPTNRLALLLLFTKKN
jgi:hypothetical protein